MLIMAAIHPCRHQSITSPCVQDTVAVINRSNVLGPREEQVSTSHAEWLDIIKGNKQGLSLENKNTHQLFWAENQDFLIK